jgi:PS-10 peptidase S37
MFVYGANDPWSAESFELGKGTRDSFKYVVPGANHLTGIVELDDAEQLDAGNVVRRWAGLPPFKADRRGPSSALGAVIDTALATPLDGLEPFFRRL